LTAFVGVAEYNSFTRAANWYTPISTLQCDRKHGSDIELLSYRADGTIVKAEVPSA
jgi:hypothetical protein